MLAPKLPQLAARVENTVQERSADRASQDDEPPTGSEQPGPKAQSVAQIGRKRSTPVRQGGVKSKRRLKAVRNQLLTEAQERWRPTAGRRIPFAWIHKEAGVDHKDAYSWKSGKLSVKSVMTTNIERVLQSPTPPRNPNPQSD